MAVEITVDKWKAHLEPRRRFETWCHGPLKVPGRRGMSWEEEDWIDEEAVAHRGADE